MKTNIEIKSFEEKKKKDGSNYLRVETSSGWASVFDNELAETIKNSVGKVLSVELTEKGNFKNITKLYGEGKGTAPTETPTTPTTTMPQANSDGKHTTMYVSYAKDLWICMQETKMCPEISEKAQMQIAIDLINHAREAF